MVERKKSDWNMLVKKVFDEHKAKNPNFKLGDAMKLASSMRKSGKTGSMSHLTRKTLHKKGKKSKIHGGKTRRKTRRHHKKH